MKRSHRRPTFGDIVIGRAPTGARFFPGLRLGTAILAIALLSGLPIVVSSPSRAASTETLVQLQPLPGVLRNDAAPKEPAPLVVDTQRNLGFAIGLDEGGQKRLGTYDLQKLERRPLGVVPSAVGSKDIFRFAIDERGGRLIGPAKALTVTADACDPSVGTKLRVYDYDENGDFPREPAELTMPCSGSYGFLLLSASIYESEGRQKLVAAGTYEQEGWRAQPNLSALGPANNLGQPLVVRQLDLARLDNDEWRDSLDWEIDLRYAGCGRWDTARVLVERLGDDLLSYCWDTRPVLRSLGAQGYVVRIPLGDDGRPSTTKQTPELPDPTNPAAALPVPSPSELPSVPPAPNPLSWLGGNTNPVTWLTQDFVDWICPLPVPVNPPLVGERCRNAPTGDELDPPSPPGADTDKAIEDVTGFGNGVTDQIDPDNPPPLPDPTNPSNSRFIANALVRRVPTFPGSAFPFVDRASARLLLLTSDDLNGNAVWVFDPGEERFVGLFTGGDPEQNPLKTAAGFDAASGRGYVVTSKGILVGSVRKSQLSGRVHPVLGDFTDNGRRFERTVPAQAVAVAPSLRRLIVPVFEQEVLPPLPTDEFDEMPRVTRVLDLLAALLGATRETPPNVGRAGDAIQHFLDDDPMGQPLGACVGGVSTSIGWVIPCVNDILGRLQQESSIATLGSCLDGLATASPATLGEALGGCTEGLNRYLGQHRPADTRPRETRARYYVLEDRIPEEPEPRADDPDSFTLQIDEEPGKTDVDQAGAASASGAHLLVVGGLPRFANQADLFCEGPNDFWDDTVPVRERELFSGQCLADQVISSGNREYHVAYVETDTGSATGSNAEASGFFVPLTEHPTDEDIRNTGACGAGTLRRLANPGTSQSEEFQNGFDDFLAGARQACDPLQGALHDAVLGDDLREGTHGGEHPTDEDGDGLAEPVDADDKGKGFPVPAAICNDFGGNPNEDREPREAKSALFSATAVCDADNVTVGGQALAAAPVLPPVLAQTVGVGRVWSDVRSAATPQGQATVAVSVAEGVRVGPLSIGSIRAGALTNAKGRTGTASASFAQAWCDVQLGSLTLAKGCVDPSSDPDIQTAIDDLNQALGKVRISVPEANGKTGRGEGSPGGYQGVVTKHPELRAADQAVNEDDSLTAAGLQIVVYNDGTEGRNRIVLQLAGVQAESRYGIVLLPDFDIPDLPELDFLDDPIVEALEVAATTPPQYEIIEAIPASVGSRNPLAEFFQAPFSSLRDLLGWIMQNWREAMLLFLLLSILSTPLYLFLRRRAFEQAMVS